MTPSNGNIFRVTGHLCGEFTGPRWIPRQWSGALMASLMCPWINGWVNNDEAGDLRRYRTHCDVTVMWCMMANWRHRASDILVNNGSNNRLSNVGHRVILQTSAELLLRPNANENRPIYIQRKAFEMHLEMTAILLRPQYVDSLPKTRYLTGSNANLHMRQ